MYVHLGTRVDILIQKILNTAQLTYFKINIQGAPLIGYTFNGLIARSAGALSKFCFHIIQL